MMNRTERLLNLLQILRSYRYPVSGERLAERLNVSIRTLYRDIATLRKIFDVLPTNIKNSINAFSLRVGPPISESLAKEDLSVLRDAIAKQKKVNIVYKLEGSKENQQTVWPFTIGYFTNGRVLVAWCEKQKSYSHFKTNRIISLKILDEHYPRSKAGNTSSPNQKEASVSGTLVFDRVIT